jgi:hypothetical protein
MELSVFSCLEMFRQTLESNLGIGESKLGFWGENGSFSRNYCHNSQPYSQLRVECEQEWLPGGYSQMRVRSLAVASCTGQQTPVLHSCAFSLVSVVNWFLV